MSEFRIIQDKMLNLCTDEEEERSIAEYAEEFEDIYFDAVAKAKLIILSHNNALNSPVNTAKPSSCASTHEISVIPPSACTSNHSAVNSQIKLPRIELPKFSGRHEEWLEFRSKFESMVHHNDTILQIQKFHYLKSCLTGSACHIIMPLEFNSENYETAWDTLVKRFHKTSVLIYNHIKGLFSIPYVSADSPTLIRNLVDKARRHIHCLKMLDEPVETWDTILIYLLSTKLDKTLLQEYESDKRQQSTSDLAAFFLFLENKAEFLETLASRNNNRKQTTSEKTCSFVTKSNHCSYCKKNHSIFKCEEFKKLDVSERISKINSLNLCLNCFGRKNHAVENCFKKPCSACSQKHNILLHSEKPAKETHTEQSPSTSFANCSSNICNSEVLLATACVSVVGADQQRYTARALLDCGSQANFITTEFANLLNLPKQSSNISIVGINSMKSKINETSRVQLISNNSDYEQTICCHILQNITGYLPTNSFPVETLNLPSNVKLADPEFFISNKIDILLGASVVWNIFQENIIHLGTSSLQLRESKLGWIVTGPITVPQVTQSHCNLANIDLHNQIEKFWSVEETCQDELVSNDDDICEQIFKETVSRGEDGRFIVKLPICKPIFKLSNTRDIALKRFQSIERKFNTNPVFKTRYSEFMSEYLTLNHMSELDPNEKPLYILPHHGVLKEESSTTKLRVVFDGSAQVSSELSLNDIQFTGPKLQDDITPLLLRFRQHPIVVTGDIEKMYRQIWVSPDLQLLQVILWRFSPEEILKLYKLKTVTYGLRSSPHLAIRCLKELGYTNITIHHLAALAIIHDFYVDDLLTGAKTEAEAYILAITIADILKSAGFNLRKWASNSQAIQSKLSGQPQNVVLGEKSQTRTLGLLWSTSEDTLKIKIEKPNTPSKLTKRNILSSIAKIYDPIGLVAPVVILAKLFMQKLWTCKMEWDDIAPANIAQEWEIFVEQLPTLNSLEIPRFILVDNVVSIELHGFADACQSGFGACCYVRAISESGNISVKLLCAKSRVAPLKLVTIPRLELSAALLLSQLCQIVKNSLTITFNSIYLWSDSTITLHWINTAPNLLKLFVANRVAKIQRTTNKSSWRHVKSKDNPADLVSRGLLPNELITSELWWKGPTWLTDDECCWPETILEFKNPPPELKVLSKSANHTAITDPIFNKFSSYTKLKRVTAYILRFVHNCRFPSNRNFDNLLINQLDAAEITLIKLCQEEMYSDIKHQILTKNIIPKQFRALSPFLDSNGVLRVGGRLNSNQYAFAKRHPALISPKHVLAKLIFEFYHKTFYHLAPNALLAATREKFWIIGGRSLARAVVHNCVICTRCNPTPSVPIMASLPENRITCSAPFSVVGVDYAGPIQIRDRKGRGCKSIKAYFAIFICFSVKAVHIETVTDLTTEAFLLAFKRFIARRGYPSQVYSDNGRNFVGAQHELAKLTTVLQANSTEIVNNLSKFGISWHFTPPYTPHMGGLWERSVKSIKHYLKRVMLTTKYTFEELNTALTQIEAIINSRPLCPLSSDPNDLEALTPSHFLVGRRLDAIPEGDVTTLPENRLTTYQSIQRTQQLFWKRWRKEYLSELQQRSKWHSTKNALQEKMLVIVEDAQLPPMQWKMGRIAKLYPGKDGVARVADVTTAEGRIRRPATRLYPLPVTDAVN